MCKLFSYLVAIADFYGSKRNNLTKETVNILSCYRNAEVHHKAVNAIRNLMTSQDIDGRFAGAISHSNSDSNSAKKLSMVANLYLPVIAICLDNLAKVEKKLLQSQISDIMDLKLIR